MSTRTPELANKSLRPLNGCASKGWMICFEGMGATPKLSHHLITSQSTVNLSQEERISRGSHILGACLSQLPGSFVLPVRKTLGLPLHQLPLSWGLYKAGQPNEEGRTSCILTCFLVASCWAFWPCCSSLPNRLVMHPSRQANSEAPQCDMGEKTRPRSFLIRVPFRRFYCHRGGPV